MNNVELISVVVPLYNKAPWVHRCIQSILDQTYHNIEILVVNDGSTDSSRDIVMAIKDERIRIVDKPNGGSATARNYGIDKAKGKYIAFIDADDEWLPRHLEYMIQGFKQVPNAILVCNDLMEVFDGKEKSAIKRSFPSLFHQDKNVTQYYLIEDYLETLKEGYFLLSGSSVLIDIQIIKENNLLFLSEAEPAEDINYWLRLNQLGEFVFCNYIGLYYHRIDSESIMNKQTDEAKLVPPFLQMIDIAEYNDEEQKNIKKFLTREYYKKAYQNRGLPLCISELSTRVGGDMEIGRWKCMLYLAIRYCPQFIIALYKKIK